MLDESMDPLERFKRRLFDYGSIMELIGGLMADPDHRPTRLAKYEAEGDRVYAELCDMYTGAAEARKALAMRELGF